MLSQYRNVTDTERDRQTDRQTELLHQYRTLASIAVLTHDNKIH